MEPGSAHTSVGQELSGDVYATLREMAHRYLASERRGHTLQPTALVHEAYLRLAGRTGPIGLGREELVAAAAHVMRLVLVDHARRHRAIKRGGRMERQELDDEALRQDGRVSWIDLDAALERLAAMDAELARVVELLYFGGLTQDEAAGVLNCSARSVRRAWQVARLWLAKELGSCEAP